MKADYQIIAYYVYCEIADPRAEAKKHKNFLDTLDAKARIYFAFNGINAQMSLRSDHVDPYIEWMRQDPRFAKILFKMDPYHEHVFPRLTVKVRDQLVALDRSPNLAQRGEHVSPERWREMLEKKDDATLLIDVRNDYESKIGYFEGAECPDVETFRRFPEWADDLAKRRDPKKTKVMMYCTGGIRCETYSALLKEKGFEEVYQLEGGIINYGHKVGGDHWKGTLFVFDDRLTVPISDSTEPEIVSTCHCCQIHSDSYYNCANMDCNELFLSCLPCAEKLQGCCSEECMSAQRRRPFEKREKPKPFRKWYHYGQNKQCDVHCCSSGE
jgi:UPF0176 protein